MKKIFILCIAGMAFASCTQNNAQQNTKEAGAAPVAASTTAAANVPASPDAPVMTFEKESYDFGKIKQGEKVLYDFKFKNTGRTPLIVSNATATCGCTIPEPPKDPIKPGGEGVIKVVFNSANKRGMQDKVVTITSNGNPGTNEVHLTGEVQAPD